MSPPTNNTNAQIPQIETRHIPIPTFGGNGSERELTGFIRACERFLSSVSGDDSVKINLVLSRLTGDAANIIYRGNHNFTWPAIKTLLQQRYGRWAIQIEDIVFEIQNLQPSTDRIVPLLHDLEEIVAEGESLNPGAQSILEPLARQTVLKYLPPIYEDLCKMDSYQEICNKARRLDREGYRVVKKHNKAPSHPNAPQPNIQKYVPPSQPKWQPPVRPQYNSHRPFTPNNNSNRPQRHTYPPSPFSNKIRQMQNNARPTYPQHFPPQLSEDVTMRTVTDRPPMKRPRELHNIEGETESLETDHFLEFCKEMYSQYYPTEIDEPEREENFQIDETDNTPT